MKIYEFQPPYLDGSGPGEDCSMSKCSLYIEGRVKIFCKIKGCFNDDNYYKRDRK